MREIIGGEKLWRVEIGQEKKSYTLYVVSTQKPMLIFESYFGKLRRMFDLSSGKPQPQPVFYIPKEEKATVERSDQMHGFKLQHITSQHIILSIENPQEKDLYEISLASREIKGFLRKEYVLAADKIEAVRLTEKFKPIYWVKVKKAKKMDCYPIVRVNSKTIVLEKV